LKHVSRRTQRLALTSGALLCCVLVLFSVTRVRIHAQTTVSRPLLGTAGAFAVLGGSTVTNTGPTVVNGDLGVSPGTAVTGFPPGLVHGVIHKADAVALQAQDDVATAYTMIAGQACTKDMTGQDLGGKTLVAGVYCFSSSAQLTGFLVLDGQGNAESVFLFQIGSTLTTASNAGVFLINGAQACNVFWQVGSSATIGTGTHFTGNILALASITATTDATFNGSLYARTGAVTLDSNTISRASCERGGTPTATPTKTPTALPTFPGMPNTGSDPYTP
jgi:Ice-binding-like